MVMLVQVVSLSLQDNHFWAWNCLWNTRTQLHAEYKPSTSRIVNWTTYWTLYFPHLLTSSLEFMSISKAISLFIIMN